MNRWLLMACLALRPLFSIGEIVFTPWAGDLTTRPPPNDLMLDMNADGYAEFKFSAVMDAPLYYVNIYSLNSSQVLYPNLLGIISVRPLSIGEKIDATALDGQAQWVDQMGILSHHDLVYPTGSVKGGPFLATNAFLGVSFQVDSETYYGWIQIDNPSDNPGGTITGFAYETQPGVGIAAGAIPEPATALLFGIGGMSVWLFRRHRQKSILQSNSPI